eukprot:scaffold6436_cov158-Amphora_coffeaeformis.AAC.4
MGSAPKSSPATTPTNKSKRRRGAACPFTAETNFIVETAPELPSTPLDMYLDWDETKKPLAARWLNAGISGQDTPGVLRAGLKRLRDQKWFLVEDVASTFNHELGLKHKALDNPERFPKVYVQEKDSVAAQKETLDLFLHYLPLRYPDYYDYDPQAQTITVKPFQQTYRIQDYASRPLELCARIVQEDLVLMRPSRPTDDSKSFAMAAAAVVFSFQELQEKLSKPVEWIHAPVPHFHTQLRKTLDLTFGKLLKIEQPMWRNNWAIAPSGTLDEPVYGSEAATANRKLPGKPSVEALESKFLKVEYQTIRRLPQSGYLLFTIKTMADSLSGLREVPAAALCLAKSIQGMSPAMQAYKGIENAETCEAVLEYLEMIGKTDSVTAASSDDSASSEDEAVSS